MNNKRRTAVALITILVVCSVFIVAASPSKADRPEDLPVEGSLEPTSWKLPSFSLPKDENLYPIGLQEEDQVPSPAYYPPYFRDYLPGYPLAVSSQRRDSLAAVEKNLYFPPLSGNLLTFTPVSEGIASGNWELPLPSLSPYERVYIPVMAAPAYLGEGQRLFLPSFISGKYDDYVLYTVGDWETQTTRTLRGKELCWKTPAVVPPYLSSKKLAVVVGGQFSAARGEAAVEWLDLENGQNRLYPLRRGEYLSDDPRYTVQVGRFTRDLGEPQVGFPLSGHYVVMDVAGGRLDVRRIALPERSLGADLDHDGWDEVIYSKAGEGKISVAKVDGFQPPTEFPVYYDGEAPSLWSITSLAAFSSQGKTYIFATAATASFVRTRLVLLKADKDGQLSFRFLSGDGDRQLPVGYGLAGIVTNDQILLVSNGYESGLEAQRFLAVLLYSLKTGEISVKEVYRFGRWEDGLTSIGYPLVRRLDSSIGIYAQLNLHSLSDTWLIGLEVFPTTSNPSHLPAEGDAHSWTDSRGGNNFYTRTLPPVSE